MKVIARKAEVGKGAPIKESIKLPQAASLLFFHVAPSCMKPTSHAPPLVLTIDGAP
jgi:hypothetical protein